MGNPADTAPNAFVADYPSRDILTRLAEKWTMLAIAAPQDGPLRFGVLKRRIEGVSQKMLTQTLRGLERDGIVMRKVFDEMPLRVEYSLTPLGQTLLPLIQAVKAWAEDNMEPVSESREERSAIPPPAAVSAGPSRRSRR